MVVVVTVVGVTGAVVAMVDGVGVVVVVEGVVVVVVGVIDVGGAAPAVVGGDVVPLVPEFNAPSEIFAGVEWKLRTPASPAIVPITTNGARFMILVLWSLRQLS